MDDNHHIYCTCIGSGARQCDHSKPIGLRGDPESSPAASTSPHDQQGALASHIMFQNSSYHRGNPMPAEQVLSADATANVPDGETVSHRFDSTPAIRDLSHHALRLKPDGLSQTSFAGTGNGTNAVASTASSATRPTLIWEDDRAPGYKHDSPARGCESNEQNESMQELVRKLSLHETRRSSSASVPARLPHIHEDDHHQKHMLMASPDMKIDHNPKPAGAEQENLSIEEFLKASRAAPLAYRRAAEVAAQSPNRVYKKPRMRKPLHQRTKKSRSGHPAPQGTPSAHPV